MLFAEMEGRAMGQVHNGCATTTAAVRPAVQHKDRPCRRTGAPRRPEAATPRPGTADFHRRGVIEAPPVPGRWREHEHGAHPSHGSLWRAAAHGSAARPPEDHDLVAGLGAQGDAGHRAARSKATIPPCCGRSGSALRVPARRRSRRHHRRIHRSGKAARACRCGHDPGSRAKRRHVPHTQNAPPVAQGRYGRSSSRATI